MYYSIVIPLYNRPDELDELLSSLCEQTDKRFEVIVAEDGSRQKGDRVVAKYRDRLPITYFEKPNSGPGLTRNAGAARATGNYLVFFDSDCIIPPHYIATITTFLENHPVDAYGGPDAALPTFTPVQKAINHAMTSFFTTGGIRGGKRSMEKFHPRSFNLGVSKTAFDKLGGYGAMRFGEDIDFSLRLMKAGYRTALIPDAYVYHKRRSTFPQFFKQVFNSGIARINLHLLHPGSLRLVHLLPALFVAGMMLILLIGLFFRALLLLPLLYSLVIFIDSLRINRSVKIALYSMVAAWIQLTGYGVGFIAAMWKRVIRKKGSFSAFEKRFYD
ncbi:MAG: glycosyltransferase [bacterium]|nr:glycosyltransferase [bacterium]MDD3624494.1 glycosyltransferase [Proteiniphilum sp.]MDD3967732.1 glycosyltransferase [Proteiniphilum sp.]MDD4458915.1 glycosyltransferase [Proteiniphilum sp.]